MQQNIFLCFQWIYKLFETLRMATVNLRRRNIVKAALLLLSFAVFVLLLGSSFTKKSSSHKRDGNVLMPSKSSASSLNAGPVLQLPKLVGNFSLTRSYTLEEMRSQAALLNFQQNVKNKEKFGDHRADDPVIVVQTHDRDNFFKLMLESLRTVKGIETVTLIISRDKFTAELDKIIDNEIDFCRYIEIFFPFSMQLYPNTFPGEDPNDCPRDLSKPEARKRGCNNAECPDMYGHYREVKFVQLKHHWYWKLNMVFNGISEITKNTGPILFLEDDNYVVPDIVHVMRKMQALLDSSCPECLGMTLGAYDSTTDYKQLGASTDVKSWVSSKHNIGMVLNQNFFDQLSSCSEYFCKYDDYNWDWSLQSTALKCMPSHLLSLVAKVPRVYHLGCTGFHQKQGGKCDVDGEVRRLKAIIEAETGLFPENMQILTTTKTPNPAHTENGGWGDIRDHELCKKYPSLSKTYSFKDAS